MTSHPYPAHEIKWRKPPYSSNVDAIGWDNLGDVYIRFKSGRVYMFKGVSRQRAVAASLSSRPGRYVNKNIIPFYPSVQVQ